MGELAYQLKQEVVKSCDSEFTVNNDPSAILRSEFLATMGHELKTPLNAILGFSKLLQEAGDLPLSEQRVNEYAEYIHESGTHLLNIINDILQMAKVDNHTIPLNENHVEVSHLLKSTMNIVKNSAAEKGVNLFYELENHKIELNIDEQKIRQSIINIVQNSIKFSEPGSMISVMTGLDINGDFYIRVEDEGIGIPANKLEHVLEPFAQAENSNIRYHDGIGLGLSLVQAYLKMHFGRIRIQSQVNQGTCVTLIIPKSRVVSD